MSARPARALLVCRDGEVRARDDGSFPSAVEELRERSLREPLDVEIHRAAALGGLRAYPARVDLRSPFVRRLLEDAPVADPHLHLGGAFRFDDLWLGLLARVASGHAEDAWMASDSPPSLPGVDPDPRRAARHFQALVACAALVRLRLALLLRHGSTDFDQRRRDLDARLARSSRLRRALPVLAESWSAVSSGAPAPAYRELVAVLSATHHRFEVVPAQRPLLGSLRRCRRIADVRARDPLARLFPGVASPEAAWLRLAFCALEGPAPDPSLRSAFEGYQRIRSAVYEWLVQPPGPPGLDRFQTYYRRLEAVRAPIDLALVDTALALQSDGTNLVSLEVRTTPQVSWDRNRDLLRALAEAALAYVPAPGKRTPEVGLVLHFLKKKEGKPDARRPARWRYEAEAQGYARQAAALETLLRLEPDWLALLRGIDVASSELAAPNWLFVAPFRRVRAAGDRAAARVRERHPDWGDTGLRATFHAGEDFRTLSEGLRRVSELLDFGLLRMGDRVGHAIALGTDPNAFVSERQPALERLWDLVWEHQLLCGSSGAIDRRLEVECLGRVIFGEPVSYAEVVEARRLLHEPAFLERLGFPHRSRGASGGRPARLCAALLEDPQVRARGDRLSLRTSSSPSLLEAAQVLLRRRLSAMEISIEINPSSNRLIGGLGSILEHPVFRLHPRDRTPTLADESVVLPIALGSDDPLTFATSLADEYAYLYAALLGEGVPSPVALRWLDEVREGAVRARFTLPVSADPRVLEELLGRGRGASRHRRARDRHS